MRMLAYALASVCLLIIAEVAACSFSKNIVCELKDDIWTCRDTSKDPQFN